MKVDVEIDLGEVRQILEKALKEKLGLDIGKISITSYAKPRAVFNEDGLVEMIETRHRIVT